MEYKEINQDSKYFYYFADNKSQFTCLDYLWEKLGGTKFCLPDIVDKTVQDIKGVLNINTWLIYHTIKSCE